MTQRVLVSNLMIKDGLMEMLLVFNCNAKMVMENVEAISLYKIKYILKDKIF